MEQLSAFVEFAPAKRSITVAIAFAIGFPLCSVGVTNRKHLTPPHGVPLPGGLHPVRRGGARRDIGDRVYLKPVAEADQPELTGDAAKTSEGWALNVSRGGVRVIVEEKLALGTSYDVTVGEEVGLTRRGRIVWLQEEPDGLIVGLEFLGVSQSMRSAPPPPPEGAEVLPGREPEK